MQGVAHWGLRLALFLGVLWISALGAAQNATLTLKAFPEALVADGAGTLTLSVQVRDRGGNPVPDGTEVLFDATLGTLRPASARTQNGLAQTTLTAGTLVGTARINVSVLAFRATASIDVPLVRTRAELNQQREVVELVAPNRLTYAPELRIFRADGPGRRVHLRFEGGEIFADDLQYEVLRARVIARRAVLRLDGREQIFSQLSYDLRARSGMGIASFQSPVPRIRPGGRFFRVEAEPRERTGPVEVSGLEIQPVSGALAESTFAFSEIDELPTLIYARSARIYPQREVQFQHAEVDIQGNRVLRVPLFRVSTQAVRPVLTEEFVQVANNQINLDYPAYLSLGPSGSSVVRLRYGTRFARGVGAAGGLSLDFERRWSLGGDQLGFFRFNGIGRRDWGAGVQQAFRFGNRSNVYLQADLPANRSVVGNLNADSRLSRRITANLSVSASRAIRGLENISLDQNLNVRHDPVPVRGLPVSLTFGLAASQRSFESGDFSSFSRSAGVDVLATLLPVQIPGVGTVSVSGRSSYLMGYRTRRGLNSGLQAALSTGLGRQVSLNLTYDFSDDQGTASFLGQHRLSIMTTASLGRFYLSAFLGQSLGLTRTNLQMDSSYRFSPLWRVGAGFTLERFRTSRYQDASVVVAYTFGMREVGLSWSQRRNRIGIEVLGTPIR